MWIARSTDSGVTFDWTRNINGIDGNLAALHHSSGTVTLQLANLHGDIVATAANTTTATGVTTYAEQTEYGIPRETNAANPTRYGWLGAKERSSDALGVMLMGVRLYNPATGRFLSLDPIHGGGANAYAYPTNPVNMFDLDGKAWFGPIAAGVARALSACKHHCTRLLAMAGHAMKRGAGTIALGTMLTLGKAVLRVHGLRVPRGYVGGWDRNRRGVHWAPRGGSGNANMIRVYVSHKNKLTMQYYNKSQQPLNPLTGGPGTKADTHINMITYWGRFRGFPG